MFRRSLLISLVMVLILGTVGTAFADTTDWLDTDSLASGIVTIHINTENEVRVMVSHDLERKVYTLNETANLPLTMGNGSYDIKVYEKIDGRFQQQATQIVTLALEDEKVLYLNSVQSVNWNEEMAAIQLAAALTEGLETDREKIDAIYSYVVANVTYDYAKARNPGGNYLPVIDSTLETGTGICYDYSALFASMLRSVGVPTKLTIGHLGSLYHAWNEVYLSETDEWVTVDTTNDALYHQYGLNYQMVKTSPLYGVEIKQ